MAASNSPPEPIRKEWTALRCHEDIFLERYHWLRGWALRLAGNLTDADDLLHDAFLQFVLRRRDLSEIGSIDAYLYGMLRRLRLSKRRAALRAREDPLDVIDYDTAEVSLRAVDPRDAIGVVQELQRVCAYACQRKETSKSGSVLLLRFFHGFFPGEIARILKCSLGAANEWLRVARREGREYLASPLQIRGDLNAGRCNERDEAAGSADPLIHLRQRIWAARRNDCPDPQSLAGTYAGSETPSCTLLAHMVSCADCLGRVAALLGMHGPIDRDPHDTLRQDTSWRFGRGSSSSGNGAHVPTQLRRWERDVSTVVLPVLLLAAAVGIWTRAPWRAEPVSAAQILADARTLETKVASAPHMVVRRVLQLEERRLPDGIVLGRRRIERWHSGGRQVTARRVYDDRGRLVAGEWLRPDGTRTIYGIGQAPRVKRATETVPIAAATIWQWEPSAIAFEQLARGQQSAVVREERGRYTLTYRSALEDGRDGLVEATLVVAKHPLRPIAQTLVVREKGEMRQFDFAETTHAEVPDASVPDTTFNPEPELVPAASPAKPIAAPAPRNAITRPIVDRRALDRLEVDLLFALHRLEGCLTMPAELAARDAVLTVTAAAASDECGDRIERAVHAAGADNVRAVVTFATAAGSPAADVTQSRAELEALPAYRALIARFAAAELSAASDRGARDDAAVMAARAFGAWTLEHSRRAYDEALHLDRLTGRWNVGALETLDLDRLARWQDVVRDHARRLRRETEGLQAQLRSVLPAAAAGGHAEPTHRVIAVRGVGDARPAVERLNALASAQREAVRRLLDPVLKAPRVPVDLAAVMDALQEAVAQAAWFDEPWTLAAQTTAFDIVAPTHHIPVKAR